MPVFHRVCKTTDLAPGEVRLVEADRTKVALCNKEGQYFAVSNFCPHLTGNLSEGKIEDDVLVCPEHGWRFKLATGRCTTMPGQSAHTFPVRIEEEWVLVGV